MKHGKAALLRVTDLVEQLKSLDAVIQHHRQQDDARAHFVLPQYEERRHRLTTDLVDGLRDLLTEELLRQKNAQETFSHSLLYVLSKLIVKFLPADEVYGPGGNSDQQLQELEALLADG